MPKILQHVALQRYLSPGAAVGGTVGGSADAVTCSPSCAADGAPAGGKCRRSCLSLLVSSRVFRWVRVAAALGAYGGLLVESGALPPGYTAPGQGGIGILARADVDVPVIMLFVFQQSKSYVFCAAIQFIDRVPDLPIVPQKRDSTVQFLNKVVDACCAQQLPMVQTVLPLRSSTRSLTSLF